MTSKTQHLNKLGLLMPEQKSQLKDIPRIKALGGEQDDFTIPDLIWSGSNDMLGNLSTVKIEGKKQDNHERKMQSSHDVFDTVLREIIK